MKKLANNPGPTPKSDDNGWFQPSDAKYRLEFIKVINRDIPTLERVIAKFSDSDKSPRRIVLVINKISEI